MSKERSSVTSLWNPIFPSLGGYFTSTCFTIRLQSSLQDLVMSTSVIKIGRKAGQGPWIQNRISDLTNHCPPTYSSDIQRYWFSSTLLSPISRKLLLNILSPWCLFLSNPSLTWSIPPYTSNNSNDIPPLSRQVPDGKGPPFPFATSVAQLVTSEPHIFLHSFYHLPVHCTVFWQEGYRDNSFPPYSTENSKKRKPCLGAGWPEAQ